MLLVVSAVLLVALAAAFLVVRDELDLSTQRSGASDSPETVAGQLVALPPIVHPGSRPAAAGRSSALFRARFDAPSSGQVALLEQRVGTDWRVVSSADLEGGRTATFTVSTPRRGSKDYRAVLLGEGGARKAVTGTASRGWSVSFADDFDGTELDTSKWMYRQLDFYNESGSRKCSKSDERAVSVSKGTLRLQVMADPERAWESCDTEYGTFGYYLNGHVATEGIFEFKYGVAAARVKFQQGRGQHGAFWLQREDKEQVPGDPAASGAEIDIVEFFGEGYPEGGLAAFLYYLNAQGENEKVGGVWPKATKQLPPGDAWWRSFHVFSVEWSPREYVFRVDGREIFRTREGVSGVEQFLILSLLSSDWELPKLDESTLPSTMEVDWVRVWQRDRAQR